MAATERWYFTKEQLNNSPSRSCGIDTDKELSYRQQAANLIQDMGQRLQVTQLCINTAIVYMHRFYVFHSFVRFHRNAISTCALFLAAKVEEQPRKLEHVIKISHMCLERNKPSLDTKSESYMEEAHDIVINENIMLQTLGFDIAIDHPHTYVVKCCQLVRASKDLAQTSYFMATNSLHLTTMCLQYKPTLVACVCIHLACKWSDWEIPLSSEGKEWFWYVDRTVTIDQLEELTSEFLAILDKCPSRLKRKIMSGNSKQEGQSLTDKKGKGDANTSTSTTNSSMSASEQNMDLENFLESKEFLDNQQEAMSGHIHSGKFSPGTESFDFRNSSGNLSALNHLSPRSCGVFSEPSTTISPSKKKIDAGHSISLAAYRDRESKERKDNKRRPNDGGHNKPAKEVMYHDKPEVHSAPPTKNNPQKLPEDGRAMHHHDRKMRHPQPPIKNSSSGNSNSSSEKIIQAERGSKTLPSNSGPSFQHRDTRRPDPHGDHSSSFLNETSSSGSMPSSEAKFQKMYYDIQQSSMDKVSPGEKVDYGKQFSDILNEELKTQLDSSSNNNPNADNESSSHPEDKYLNILKPKEEPIQMIPPISTSQQSSSGGMQKSPVIATKSPASKSRPKHSKRKSPVVAAEGPVMHSTPTESQHNPAQAAAQAMPEKKPSHRRKSPIVKDNRPHSGRMENESMDPVRHDRREKHKPPLPARSQDMLATGIAAPPTGGLKITIPKDKIMLGSLKNAESSQPKMDLALGASSSPPREALKIKIPKMKLSVPDNAKLGAGSSSKSTGNFGKIPAKMENPPPSETSIASSSVANTNPTNTGSTGLKLVITKDRLNSGTYSTSVAQKPEKESRKRERYSKDNVPPPQASSSASSANVAGVDQTMDKFQTAPKAQRGNNTSAPRGGRGRKGNQPPVSDKNGRNQGQQHYSASNGKSDYNNAYHPPPAKRGRGGRPPQYNNMMLPYGRPDFFPQQQQYFPYPGPPMGQPMYHHPPNQPMLFNNPPPLPPPPPMQLGRPPLPSEPPPRPPPLPPGDR